MKKQLQILLVDDEENIREGLRYLIDWEEEGYRVIGTACNGAEAYKICQENQVDVILTDIRMPIMDGLELAKKVYYEMEDTVVIIMSAYKDFSYAQEAIRYRVQSYISKPIVSRELCLELNRIRRNSVISDKYRQKKNELIRKLVFSQISGGELSDIYRCAGEYGMNLDDSVFQCVQVRFAEKNENLIREICAYMEKNRMGYGCKDINGNLVLLFIFAKERMQDIHKFVFMIREEMDQASQAEIQIAVGQRVNSVELINKSYRQTNNLYFLNLFQNGENIIFCEELVPDRRNGITGVVDKLCSYIAAEQRQEINYLAEELKYSVVKARVSKEEMYGLVQQLFDRLREKYLFLSYEEEWDRILDLQTIEELVYNIRDICLKCIADAEKKELSGSTLLVKKVEEYIAEYVIEKSLNTKYIAAQLGYNSAYMGRVFVGEKGISVKEYINRKRIENACRQLAATDGSITEIALDAGYQDISTFYEVFKKYKKMTPKEYRERNKTAEKQEGRAR